MLTNFKLVRPLKSRSVLAADHHAPCYMKFKRP